MLGVASVALSFLSGPAGRVLLIGLAFFAWGTYQRIDATRDCEEAELREELLESQRQLGIAESIASEARSRADVAEADIEKLKGLSDEITKDIAAGGGGCVIDDATAERLRRIK